MKKAKIEAGAKVNHLTYIGDARVGAKANIGAGTITCNYDGFNKYITDIGRGAFIGSNSSLVAPVSIGDGAYVASGSVVTEDVPADALAFGRARQKILPERGRMLRERLASIKEAAGRKVEGRKAVQRADGPADRLSRTGACHGLTPKLIIALSR